MYSPLPSTRLTFGLKRHHSWALASRWPQQGLAKPPLAPSPPGPGRPLRGLGFMSPSYGKSPENLTKIFLAALRRCWLGVMVVMAICVEVARQSHMCIRRQMDMHCRMLMPQCSDEFSLSGSVNFFRWARGDPGTTPAAWTAKGNSRPDPGGSGRTVQPPRMPYTSKKWPAVRNSNTVVPPGLHCGVFSVPMLVAVC